MLVQQTLKHIGCLQIRAKALDSRQELSSSLAAAKTDIEKKQLEYDIVDGFKKIQNASISDFNQIITDNEMKQVLICQTLQHIECLQMRVKASNSRNERLGSEAAIARDFQTQQFKDDIADAFSKIENLSMK